MLDAIGLDRQHTEVYRLLLGLPSADAEQVARQASLGVRDARGILDDLEALGLIARQASAPDRVVASPPSVALRPILLERERRLTEAHETLVHLSDLYREGAAQRSAPDVVDVVLGPEAVVQRIGQLQASAEREVKAEVTMIVARNNNPLKFLPDAQSALLQMFAQRIPGFMGPTEAMRDAYVDLRAHEVGMVAGMRAALAEVLERFGPAALEARITERGMLDPLFPSARRARLWERYVEMHDEISREAQDDFHTLFGKAFVTAYEEEIERVRKGTGS